MDDGDLSRRGVQKWHLVSGFLTSSIATAAFEDWYWKRGVSGGNASLWKCFQGTLTTMLQPHVLFFFCFFQFSHFFAKKDFALQHDLLLDSFRMSSRPTSATGTAPTPSHHPPMLSARVEDVPRVTCWNGSVRGGPLVIYIVCQWTANNNQDFENERTSPKMDGSLAYTHWINTN